MYLSIDERVTTTPLASCRGLGLGLTLTINPCAAAKRAAADDDLILE